MWEITFYPLSSDARLEVTRDLQSFTDIIIAQLTVESKYVAIASTRFN